MFVCLNIRMIPRDLEESAKPLAHVASTGTPRIQLLLPAATYPAYQVLRSCVACYLLLMNSSNSVLLPWNASQVVPLQLPLRPGVVANPERRSMASITSTFQHDATES